MWKQTQKEQYLIEQGSALYIQIMWQFWGIQWVKHAAWTEENKTHVALQTGWTIHISKTKYIINGQKMGNEPKEIEINGQKYENVLV